MLQECKNDQSRISYATKIPEVSSLVVEQSTSLKNSEEAQSCEELYDMLVVDECNAARAVEVIQRALNKTKPQDKNELAIRLEHFNTRSLN